MEVSGQFHSSSALSLGKTDPYPLMDRSLFCNLFYDAFSVTTLYSVKAVLNPSNKTGNNHFHAAPALPHKLRS
jgi:hypothetical protein